MEESISGFKIRGDWGDVVEHGERITQALREHSVDDPGRGGEAHLASAFEEWDEWRPKAHETLEADVSEKTADQASVEEGKGEKAGKGPTRTSRPPARNSESYEQLEEDDPDAAVDNWKESIDYVARAADSAGRKALRRVEDTVYQNVMTQLAPYYFDNELVSANIQQSTRNGDAGEQFVFEVNVNDDELKEKVSDRLAEYDDEIDRWHVEVEKDTDAAEAIEGAEPPPEPEPEDNSRSTTN
ncbi:hypothetical protein D8S78_19840 [Natrialba swarupiae]|nr:hypothetical protein [Natrialba swarupiae]